MSSGDGGGWRRIYNNLCQHNGEYGIWLEQPLEASIIEHNECCYNSWDKQRAWGYWGMEVVYGGEYGAVPNPTGTPIIRYNKCHHNTIPKNSINRVHDTDGGGIGIRANNAEVYYNLCYKNEGPGIGSGHMSEGAHSNIKILNNVCYHNCQSSKGGLRSEITLSMTYNNMVINNILERDTSRNGMLISVEWVLGQEIDFNCYYGQGLFSYQWGELPLLNFAAWQVCYDTNGMHDDPEFVSPSNYNFHLESISPCINAGTDVGLTADYEGNPVPSGAYPDIGAYEYQQCSITVTSPSSGDDWWVGSTETIRWTSSGAGNYVKIELGQPSGCGTSWSPITGSTSNTGSYPWIFEGPAQNNCIIRITSIDIPEISGKSEYFDIVSITTRSTLLPAPPAAPLLPLFLPILSLVTSERKVEQG